MSLVAKIKRDILKHPQKAAVLGVLLVVMAAASVRAVVQLQSPRVEAAVLSVLPPAEMAGPVVEKETAGEAEGRIRESKELWTRLRERRGSADAVAFAFDASFYVPDPARKMPVAAAVPERVEMAPAPIDVDAVNRQREQMLREQLRGLTVKSTTVPGNGPAWAIVNQQLVKVGDFVNGFEVTAIRSREVEFRKEGVSRQVKMPDDIRGQ